MRSLVWLLALLPLTIGCVESGWKDDLEVAQGETPLLVILWDPLRPTANPKPTLEQIEDVIFGPAPSIADFISVQSYGTVTLKKAGSFSFIADKPADHYWNHPQPGEPGSDGFLSGHYEKYAEVLRKVDAEFDFAAYDTNGNGVLSPAELGILLITPQAAPDGAVRDIFGLEHPYPYRLYVDGVRLTAIAEVYSGNVADVRGVPLNFGVIGHELGHLLFLMDDFYGTTPLAAGSYSLMDVTFTDAQYDPYHRMRLGWLNPRTVTEAGEYSLGSVEKNNDVIKISRLNANPPEHFILENRQRGVYDTQLLDTGLAIWRFIDNEEADDWVNANIALLRHPRAIFDWSALWHAPRAAETGELRWADGALSGVTITNISESADVMTFTINFREGTR